MIPKEVVSIIEIFSLILWMYASIGIFGKRNMSIHKRRRMIFWLTFIIMCFMLLVLGSESLWARLKL